MMDRMLLQKVGGVQPNPFEDTFVAYSLRDLGLGANEVVIVQRASNNDFDAFTPTQITNGSLTSFCNGLGTVREWIDQKGNNNAIQLDSNFQPEIVDVNGNVNLLNNKPVLNFSNSFFNLSNQIPTNINDISIFATCQVISNKIFSLLGNDVDFGTYSSYKDDVLTPNIIVWNNNIFRQFQTTTEYDKQIIQSTIIKQLNNEFKMFINDLEMNIVSINSNSNFVNFYNTLGKRRTNVSTMMLQELILFENDKQNERTIIETNINNYYNTY